jgi:Protein of unknown function (DUF726)
VEANVERQWCSWCYKKMGHSIDMGAQYGGLHRASHHCDACSKPTTTCRALGCCNMARVEDGRADQFCATHGGVIGSFAALSATIKDPTEMVELLERRDDRNYPNLLRTAAVTALTALAAFPVAALAAPAIGGAIGVGALGLSGAAAQSAGLAWLGLGSLATGGLGMAGGVALVTAVGGALGGTLGGVVANRYFSEVNGFTIEKIRDGRDPALICIDGFLTEGTDKSSDWLDGLGSVYEGHAVYRVRWESKTLHDLYYSAANTLGKQAVSWGVSALAQSASKAAAGVLGPVGAVFTIADLAGNPWWVAMNKAEKTGILIAETISRCDNRSFILLGHSLGARAAVAALQVLATREGAQRRSKITDVHLFGGAADLADAGHWRIATDAIDGKCYNYYTKNDAILSYLYQAANLLQSTPIGLSRLPTSDFTRGKLISIDCSEQVKGHSGYHATLRHIIKKRRNRSCRDCGRNCSVRHELEASWVGWFSAAPEIASQFQYRCSHF